MSLFKKIPYIPTADKLADMVFSQLKKIRLEPPKDKKRKGSDFSFYKTLYFRQFRFIFSEIKIQLNKLITNFPKIEELHPFHKELVDLLFDIIQLKTSLARINNSKKSIDSIEKDVIRKLGKSQTLEEIKKIKTETLGRVGSILKKLTQPLNDLITAKMQLSKMPDFDLTGKTIVVAGPPNVGKSSFVKLVSTGKPEIASYPFTTKELICGYIKNNFEVVQIVDTPGLLDRPLSERNSIEMRSILALKYLADAIIFLFDPSNDSLLSLNQQLNLSNEIKKAFPEILIYSFINKSDLLEKEELTSIQQLIGKHEPISTLDSNVQQIKEIVVRVINAIPEKKINFIEKKIEEKDSEIQEKNKDKIEWIFRDRNSEN